MDLESNLLPEAPSIRARLWVREAQSTAHSRRGGCAVLLKAWAHASGKLDRFGLQELVGNPLTVPCGPFSSTSGLQRGFARIVLQNCASECVNDRTYRTLQGTCNEGAPCSLRQGSGALIGSLHTQALPTND